jgi:hypothetical protein
MRKIVVFRPNEWLQKGFQMQSFDASWKGLKKHVTSDMRFNEAISPVRVPHHDDSGSTEILGAGFEYTGRKGHGYALSVEFENNEAEARFASDNSKNIEGIYADPEIEACPSVCPEYAVGNDADVRQKLNLTSLQVDQIDGPRVKIMIVDTGIDQTRIPVAGGFSPNPSVHPGNSPTDHGTMVAYDALIAAPHSMIYDYPLLTSITDGKWVGLLSDGLRVFAEIMIKH